MFPKLVGTTPTKCASFSSNIHFFPHFFAAGQSRNFKKNLSSFPPQIPIEAFRRPGPTRIPKPKGFSSQKGTHGTAANLGLQCKSQTAQTGKEQASHTAASHNNNPNLVNRRLWNQRFPLFVCLFFFNHSKQEDSFQYADAKNILIVTWSKQDH